MQELPEDAAAAAAKRGPLLMLICESYNNFIFCPVCPLCLMQDLPEDAAAAKRRPLLVLIRESYNDYFRIVRCSLAVRACPPAC